MKEAFMDLELTWVEITDIIMCIETIIDISNGTLFLEIHGERLKTLKYNLEEWLSLDQIKKSMVSDNEGKVIIT